jgi:hypothetical protein
MCQAQYMSILFVLVLALGLKLLLLEQLLDKKVLV